MKFYIKLLSMPVGHINNIEHLVKRLAEKKIESVTYEKNPLAQTEAYVQSLLYRCIELTNGAINNYSNNHLLSALPTVRSLIETIIIAICFNEDLSQIVEEDFSQGLEMKGITKFDNLLVGYCLSRSNANIDFQQIAKDKLANIDPATTAAKSIKQKIKKCIELDTEQGLHIQKLYNVLVEYVHPNSLGTYLFFTDSALEKKNISIGEHIPQVKKNVREIIIDSLSTLHIFANIHEKLIIQIVRIRKLAVIHQP